MNSHQKIHAGCTFCTTIKQTKSVRLFWSRKRKNESGLILSPSTYPMNASLPVETINITATTPLSPSLLSGRRSPALLPSLPLGPCLTTWTPDHLIASSLSSKLVSVHSSSSPRLNFISKNFTYERISFAQLVANCCSSSNTFWYLRSLGDTSHSRSDLATHFPSLAAELDIPPLFSPETFFSSVFRISSPSLELWTHYDTLDNVLIQVRGSKRVVLFPPRDADKLYLVGDKTSVVDWEADDLLEKYPKLREVNCKLTNYCVVS